MTTDRMTDAELSEIERYLGERSGAESEADRWLRRLLGEVRALRGTRAEEGAPLKQHGDALLDGSGTRHGEHPPRR